VRSISAPSLDAIQLSRHHFTRTTHHFLLRLHPRDFPYTPNIASKMPTLDVTFTWAIPVDAAQLAAHVETYIRTLPVVNTVRACNRFGKGPQCHINKLPVELVQSILDYHVSAIRKKKRKKCIKLLRCYEDSCTIFDHYSKEYLLETYWEMRENDSLDSFMDGPDVPTDVDIVDYLDECGLLEDTPHFDNRVAWENRLDTWLTKMGPFLQKHFGVGTWLSQTCIGMSTRYNTSADTTLAYLTLSKVAERSKQWQRDPTDDGFQSTRTGYGFAVAIDQHATSREIQNLNRAMKILDLKVYVHESQEEVQETGLSLAPVKEQMPKAADTAISWPRPLFLVRNHTEGE
jgi:hypothetical protein